MIDRRAAETGVQVSGAAWGLRLRIIAPLLLAFACATSPKPAPSDAASDATQQPAASVPGPNDPPPMVSTFTGKRSPRKPLELATDRLLDAIEEETGLRPVDDETEWPEVRPRRTKRGWGPERSALAHELMHAIDTREATVRPVRRALAALEWDRLIGGRWPEVDQVLVARAIQSAHDALPIPPEPVDPAPAQGALEWPIVGARVTSRFGMRSDPLEPTVQFHAGIDLAAIEGQKVHAAAAGVVTYAGQRGGYGLHVELKHPDGLVTRYAHLDELLVRLGERVERGEQIAYSGRTGRVTGPHLHFELWRHGRPVDPLGELPEPE